MKNWLPPTTTITPNYTVIGELISTVNHRNETGAELYHRVRPDYPEELLRWALPEPASSVVDLGAGTGKLSAALLQRGLKVLAVDHSARMIQHLNAHLPGVLTVQASAEEPSWAQLIPKTFPQPEAVVAGQSWHWFDEPVVSQVIASVVAPGGVVAVLFTELDTQIPWVHRLSRIMHAGDVLHVRGFRPEFGEQFSAPETHSVNWQHSILARDIQALARTRSFYVKTSGQQRAKIEANLAWYLYEHVGWEPDSVVELNYRSSGFKAVKL